MLQTQSVAQFMDRHQENIVSCRETERQKVRNAWVDLVFTAADHRFPLTSLIHGAGGPRFGQVKVRVPTDAVTREVSVCQEAALAVERGAVSVKAVGEGQHDVGVLVDLPSDLAEGNLPEGERDGALPNLKGLSDGVMRGSLAHFGGVVLYAAGENGGQTA